MNRPIRDPSLNDGALPAKLGEVNLTVSGPMGQAGAGYDLRNI
jgi:hypothetical protein